nr:hypothetical protein [Elizabethkingia sp. ASV34]
MIRKTKLKENFPKKEYLPPMIEVEFVETEQCIAGSSATLHPGGIGNPNTPAVTDWTNNDINGNTDYDF